MARVPPGPRVPSSSSRGAGVALPQCVGGGLPTARATTRATVLLLTAGQSSSQDPLHGNSIVLRCWSFCGHWLWWLLLLLLLLLSHEGCGLGWVQFSRHRHRGGGSSSGGGSCGRRVIDDTHITPKCDFFEDKYENHANHDWDRESEREKGRERERER
eukprot:TRINITY_DN5925_c0_g1_i1.p2 TRINITY_DN5925_c0_g1~~TRINITY_DN5925_c0_g1_i1.p2  ORF type:complete len:158 (+),score=14.21 TRINITY_DN5925_c0_g1_i1:204-677(+)